MLITIWKSEANQKVLLKHYGKNRETAKLIPLSLVTSLKTNYIPLCNSNEDLVLRLEKNKGKTYSVNSALSIAFW